MAVRRRTHYNVQRLLKEKEVDGRRYFRVKWEGYSHRHNSWEPAEEMPERSIFIFRAIRDGVAQVYWRKGCGMRGGKRRCLRWPPAGAATAAPVRDDRGRNEVPGVLPPENRRNVENMERLEEIEMEEQFEVQPVVVPVEGMREWVVQGLRRCGEWSLSFIQYLENLCWYILCRL